MKLGDIVFVAGLGCLLLLVFAIIIPASARENDARLHARCHASLVMAKTANDTLKFLNTDRDCLTTLPDSLK